MHSQATTFFGLPGSLWHKNPPNPNKIFLKLQTFHFTSVWAFLQITFTRILHELLDYDAARFQLHDYINS
jgi:hypothetical protein